MTDIPICGFPDVNEGPCREARPCPKHDNWVQGQPHEPFGGQRPEPSAAQLARTEMITTVAASINHLIERGVLRLPTNTAGEKTASQRAAGVIVDDLAVHVLERTFQGVAVGMGPG